MGTRTGTAMSLRRSSKAATSTRGSPAVCWSSGVRGLLQGRERNAENYGSRLTPIGRAEARRPAYGALGRRDGKGLEELRRAGGRRRLVRRDLGRWARHEAARQDVQG